MLTLPEIHLRDPFILPVPEEGRYYLYGTNWTLPGGPGFMVYTSGDLRSWEGPRAAFTAPEGFASYDYWAPEVHRHGGRYYMLATFRPRSPDDVRQTRVLVADCPEGPFAFHSEGPATPPSWFCLDGTLFWDGEQKPWLVFCHEWVQVGDGEVCAVRLSDDLRRRVGEPRLLFRASEAKWCRPAAFDGKSGYITDGPFLHRTASGRLLMLWSSFGEGGYKQAVAHSQSGTLGGPWTQEQRPVFEDDGGHGMVFRTFDGTLLLTLHQPNGGALERPRLLRVVEDGDRLHLGPWQP
jgi:arabinan endo-1,5-alpha-L-arabinosidase